VQFWMGKNGFGPYLQKIRAAGGQARLNQSTTLEKG